MSAPEFNDTEYSREALACPKNADTGGGKRFFGGFCSVRSEYSEGAEPSGEMPQRRDFESQRSQIAQISQRTQRSQSAERVSEEKFAQRRSL